MAMIRLRNISNRPLEFLLTEDGFRLLPSQTKLIDEIEIKGTFAEKQIEKMVNDKELRVTKGE